MNKSQIRGGNARSVYFFLTACALFAQAPGAGLHFEATLQGHVFAPRERIPIEFAITNRSSRHMVVPDPSRGPALRILLRTPSGEKSVSVWEARTPPGVPPIRGDWGLPPGVRRVFILDVAALADLSQRGNYIVVLEYTLPGAPVWKSPEMKFTIAPATER